jgi:hypothetical protein
MPYEEELFALAMDFSNDPELHALKKRFSGWSICKDHATAAAFGYLAAMRDVEKESEEEDVCVFDHICTIMDRVRDKQLTSEEATELSLGLVYNWLKEAFAEEGFAGDIIGCLNEKFEPFVKPGVIS